MKRLLVKEIFSVCAKVAYKMGAWGTKSSMGVTGWVREGTRFPHTPILVGCVVFLSLGKKKNNTK
jgi:hypothetical protein